MSRAVCRSFKERIASLIGRFNFAGTIRLSLAITVCSLTFLSEKHPGARVSSTAVSALISS